MIRHLWGKIGDAFLVFRESLISFQRNNNFEKSASLAYYGFFALIPLLLLVVYVFGHFVLSSRAAFKAVEDIASQILPEFSKVVTKEVYAISRYKKIWGWLGIITLFWSITPLGGSLRIAFIRIFKADARMPYLKTMLLDAAAALTLIVLFAVLVISELVYSVIARLFVGMPQVLAVVNTGASLLLTVAVIAAFYRAFSPVKVRFSHLLAGAVSTAALWAVMRPVFTMFLKYNPDYGFAFGSLKAIFILFVWVYYSFGAVLFGGEVIANVRRKDALLLKGLFADKSLSWRTRGRIVERFVKTYDEGDILFRQGDKGTEMFYVFSGSVTLTARDTVAKVVKEGEYFGEMSLLLNSPRTATAVSSEPGTQVAVISHGTFETILREEPKVILSVLKEMALRLKMTNENL